MILFVFEGAEREPRLYKAIEKLYFPKGNNNIVCSFGNNIYELYSQLQGFDGDGDIVSLLREVLSERGDSTLEGIKSSDISETYLFFDYDFQNTNLSLAAINERMEQMLTLFADETDNGKLYINYPMVEAVRYTKELPDDDYLSYVVGRDDCRDFKQLARNFSAYNSFDHILFREGEVPSKEKYLKVSENWENLKRMNVCKANYIVNDIAEVPANADAISQIAIFDAQRRKFVDASQTVAVLCSFPIFIFDYRGK